jgi:uncharacterized lipoprotein
MKKLFISFAFILTLSGCAVTPQKVILAPNVDVKASNIGNGQELILTTVDERTSKAIGTRGISGFGAEIISEKDVTAIVRQEIEKGLMAQNFKISDSSNGVIKELRVEIRNIEYNLTPAIFSGTLRTESALKGICLNDGKRIYEQLYRGGSEKKVLVTQFAKENAVHINKAVSESISNLLKDAALMRCLTK